MDGIEVLPVNEIETSQEKTTPLPVDFGIPDGGYGWVQVAVGFSINAFTWGQTAVRSYPPI